MGAAEACVLRPADSTEADTRLTADPGVGCTSRPTPTYHSGGCQGEADALAAEGEEEGEEGSRTAAAGRERWGTVCSAAVAVGVEGQSILFSEAEPATAAVEDQEYVAGSCTHAVDCKGP